MGNRLILATRNPDKLVELRRILEAGRVPVDVGDLDEYPDLPEVAETGRTFAENQTAPTPVVTAPGIDVSPAPLTVKLNAPVTEPSVRS